MLLRLGKESVDIRWEHIVAYWFSAILLAIFLGIGIFVFAFFSKGDFAFYFGATVELMMGIVGNFIPFLIGYLMHHFYPKFSSKDLAAVAIANTALVLIASFAVSWTMAFRLADYLYAIRYVFEAAFLYIIFVFVYENLPKRMPLDVLFLALVIGLFYQFVNSVLAYPEVSALVLVLLNFLNSSGSGILLPTLNHAFFAYVAMTYIISRKGNVHAAILAIALLTLISDLFLILQIQAERLDNILDIIIVILRAIFLPLIYLVGRWLAGQHSETRK